jgi:recombination protein RecT
VNEVTTITQAPQSEAKDNLLAFKTEFARTQGDIAKSLPGNVNRDRFMNTVSVAVMNNSTLLQCTRKSLFISIFKAAEDGLFPDSREGFINAYWDKDKKVYVAQWMPMAYGIRKRARELCGIIIDTAVVYKSDVFEFERGDTPYLKHIPGDHDEDLKDMVRAYAIFRDANQTILHREVMGRAAIMRVRSKVRSPEKSMMWTTFEDEAWKKTVLRRGAKSVPSAMPEFDRLLSRDDDQFDFSEPALQQVDSSFRPRVVSSTATPGRRLTPPPPPPPAPAKAREPEPTAEWDAAAYIAKVVGHMGDADSSDAADALLEDAQGHREDGALTAAQYQEVEDAHQTRIDDLKRGR